MVARKLIPKHVMENIELRREVKRLRQKYGPPKMSEEEAVQKIIETIANHEEKNTQRIHAARIVPGVGIVGMMGEVKPNYLEQLHRASDMGAQLALEGLQRDMESHAGLAAATTFGAIAVLSKIAGHPTAAEAMKYLTAAGLGAWAKDKAVGIHLQRQAEKMVYGVARDIVEEIHENMTPEEKKERYTGGTGNRKIRKPAKQGAWTCCSPRHRIEASRTETVRLYLRNASSNRETIQT